MRLPFSSAFLAAVAAVLIATACAKATSPDLSSDSPVRGARQRGSASYVASSMSEHFPRASRTAGGWDEERLWSQHVDWEPVVAVDPFSADVYQLTTRYYAPQCRGCPDPAIAFRRSRDGGATWGKDRYLPPQGEWQVDPQIAVARNGTIFAAYLQDWQIIFVRSFDRGTSWTEPLQIPRKGSPAWGDKPILAISPDGRDVYVAFNSSDSFVAVSHNSGRRFSTPIQTNKDQRYWFHTDGAVAPNGTVYFTAADFRQDLGGSAGIQVLRSTDDGASWTVQRVDTSAEAPSCDWWAEGCYLGFFGPSPALAIDSSGQLLLAYNAGRADGDPQQIWIRSSEDGINWSPRRRRSRSSRSINNAFPAVEAGPFPGDFRLVWQDDRKTKKRRQDNSRKRWNTWYRRTQDGGATWSRAIRLSDQRALESYKRSRGYAFPFGDYLWLAVDRNGTNHVIWGEGESNEGNGGTWFTRGQ